MAIEDLIGAKKDFLTGFFTKESLAPLFVKLGGEYSIEKKPFSILLIDLDHFKSLNDKFGHLYGDEALKYFSSSLRLSLVDVEILSFRYGGDEFVVVFPGKTANEAYLSSVHLENTIKKRPFLIKGRLFKMSFSGGVAGYPGDGSTIDELIANADKAMYFSKRHGHGRITKFSKIWQARLKNLIFVFLVLAAASFLVIRFSNKKDEFLKMFNKTKKISSYPVRKKEGVWKTPKAKPVYKPTTKPAPLPVLKEEPQPQLVPLPEQQPDVVYLKSKGVLQGTIFYENAQELGLKLQMGSGEGSMVIKKSEIERIERAKKNEEAAAGPAAN